jgi:endonuclease YncB( thermonuclease family)
MGCFNSKSEYDTENGLPTVTTIDISPRMKKNMEFILTNLDQVKEFKPEKFKSFDFCGIVVRVKDGDTVVVNGVTSNHEGNNQTMCQYNIRLARIDAPELKSKNPEEAKKALEVKTKLVEYILYKPVIATIVKQDLYSGRYIGELNSKQLGNVSDWLLNNKYAVPYDGRKKTPFNISNFN